MALPGDGQFLMLWQTADTGRAAFSVAGESFPVVLYRCDDIHALHDRLAAVDTPITTYSDDGSHWTLKFFDPDGNMWGVLQDKQ